MKVSFPLVLLSAVVLFFAGRVVSRASERPIVRSAAREGDRIVLEVNVPSGFRNVVLEGSATLGEGGATPLIAGALEGGEGVATFRVPWDLSARFLTLRVGEEVEVPASTYSGPDYYDLTSLSEVSLTSMEKVGHVLNRVAYGPGVADLAAIEATGLEAYLEAQLDPESLDESDNLRLRQREAELFEIYEPHEDVVLLGASERWRYFKGDQAPPPGWVEVAFDDSGWLEGQLGIGYGDGDDETVLADMQQTDTQPGYPSVFVRKAFNVSDPAEVAQLILAVDFDDGFAAYLNGIEVARMNVAGSPPAHTALATDTHEAGVPVEYDLGAGAGRLVSGVNVLAIQVHNYQRASSDLSLTPDLVSRKMLPQPPLVRIRGVEELQHLVHVRGVYSRRQLQAVMAEFWENHFTTDYDKVEEYFDDLRNSDASDAMSYEQARLEAAQVEYEEYQFFYENGLGYFGDLLLYSASSPAMLIYLDGVLNLKDQPNENYAREIMELSAFGVDNRYTQLDIEELARCFTGWSVRKVWLNERPTFPASARSPLTEESVRFEDQVPLDAGPGWRYFKGEQEPSPGGAGEPMLAWTSIGFDDSLWLAGSTGIGFGDDDDATVLSDMRNNYGSVYLRRTFTVSGPEELEGLLLGMVYDDGFVAYLNGVEVARSRTMEETGTPPAFDTFARGGHEASLGEAYYSLEPFESLIRYGANANVLAVQGHNVSLSSSDLSILPRLIQRRNLPGSIENGNPNGAWVFRFRPEEHDTEAKRLFPGTAHELDLPAGREGVGGVRDAIDVIDAMVGHPSTQEFICLKLINRFVSDDIDLESYRDGTAPEALRLMLDEAMAAWRSTSPPGHIGTVMRSLLRPTTQDNVFWSRTAYRSKVKTPVEFINSSLRALDAAVVGSSLPEVNAALGMDLFTRDDPDGWSELGFDWVDTAGLLERVRFLQTLAGNSDSDMSWDFEAFAASLSDGSAATIIDYFGELLFDGHLAPGERELLLRYAGQNEQGVEVPFDPARTDYVRRAQDLLALMLSMPAWQLQ